MHEETLVDSEKAAKLLDLKSKHTLEVWRSTNRYPELEYVRVGRNIRYKLSAIEHFLSTRTVAANGEV